MRPKLAAVVLAAGASRRYGAQNKLLSDWKGEAMVSRVVRSVLESGAAQDVVVVTGYQWELVESAVVKGDGAIRFAHNPRWESGMGTSIAAGVGAIAADGYLIALGDMPNVAAETLCRLRDAWETDVERPVIPGRISPPLILPARLRSQALLLDGDRGCRMLLEAEICLQVSVDVHELEDFDEPSHDI